MSILKSNELSALERWRGKNYEKENDISIVDIYNYILLHKLCRGRRKDNRTRASQKSCHIKPCMH